jgi:phosphoglycolate phosphatase
VIRLCVFDCDGTLVDSQHVIVACMIEAFAAEGLAPPHAAAVRHVVGLPLLDAVAELVNSGDERLWRRVASAYSAAFADRRRRDDVAEPLFPGVLEGLQAFEDAGWILGIATGKSRRGVLATLGGHRLTERFVTLQTADVGPGKPNPHMMLRAMTETGASPQTTVMIGDTSYDMRMARSAGSFAIGVAWGYHDAVALRSSGAQSVVEAFDALLPAAERLLASADGAGEAPGLRSPL